MKMKYFVYEMKKIVYEMKKIVYEILLIKTNALFRNIISLNPMLDKIHSNALFSELF